MTYRIPLPAGGQRDRLDIVDPNSTAVQRFIRRNGLAAYEPPTVATLLALFDDADEGFTFHDVGANMGLYALLCAAMFRPSSVQAYEPTPPTAAVIRKIARTNRLSVDVVQAAVGDTNGRATLHLSSTSDASNSMVEGFKESHGGVDVATIRLDDHVRALGRDPDIIKIDVETFEPAVLAGASATIARARPYIVIEVLNRRGHDHGIELTEAMQPYGYTYYELSDDPCWEPRASIVGRAGNHNHDWLLAPGSLDTGFVDRYDVWRGRLAACGHELNSRVPILRSVGAAMRRGGVIEVVATARRYRAARGRSRVPPTS